MDRETRVYSLTTRFFVELRALGIDQVVIAPGSRSAPLAVSARAAGMRCTIHIDERVAGFHALGYAKQTGRPAVVVCSSGTAGANLLPAVVEAHHAQVPMIVCTADRPPELRGWGAGQTIDQMALFGVVTRWRYELPVGGETDEWLGRSSALRALSESTGRVPGPVHLNWPFREPLEPPGRLEIPNPTLTPRAVVAQQTSDQGPLERLASTYERGLVVVGPGDRDEEECAAVLAFGERHGWPVVADPCSQIRNCGGAGDATVVTTGELLFGTPEFVTDLRTEVVVRVGLAPTSKSYRLWLERHRPETLVLVGVGPDWADPTHEFDHVVEGSVTAALAGSIGRGRSGWTDLWGEAEAATVAAVQRQCREDRSELAVADAVARSMPDGSTLVVSSSMPVRDLEIVLRSDQRSVRVVCNRGANGIDGVVATALGAATAADGPTVLLIGDVAAVHDLGGLAAVGRLRPDLTIVLVDNDGGGIFSFLPIAAMGDKVWFEELFTTPHSTDLVGACEALGLATSEVPVAGLEAALAATIGDGGPSMLAVKADTGAHVSGFAALRQAVADALRGR